MAGRSAWRRFLGLNGRDARRALQAAALAMLAGCAQDPIDAPIGWWHTFEGGEIAAQRPPPPGANQPYPKLGSVPAKPALPAPAVREALRTSLTAQRDQVARNASHDPLIAASPPPPPKPAPAPGPGASGAAAPDATAPGAPAANATLETAEAPPPPPSPPAETPPSGPVTLAGEANFDTATLPPVPAAPPPPPSFEGIPAEPAVAWSAPPPAPRPPREADVLFASGSDQLMDSQNETLGAIAGKRGKRAVQVIGFGEAQSDTPDGQQAALKLALKRAQAVAAGLEKHGVPESAIRIGGEAFGRGASVRLLGAPA